MPQFTLVVTAVVMPLAIAHSWSGVSRSAEDPHLIGQWRVEYRFAEGASSTLEFEARESGQGSFLSIETRRSSLAPAVPGKAVWTQTSTRVRFSGHVDQPIGNVGYFMRTLAFEGVFTSANAIVGEVTDVGDAAAPRSSAPPVKGRFTATRIRGSTPATGPPNEP